MENSSKKIDIPSALKVIDPDGPLSLLLKGYEFRKQQQEMLQDVIEAYNQRHIALIEAGTGIGKSMAYLIPAILSGFNNNERTLISTNTITLQEQLLHKDIPLTAKALATPVKAVLVKGMSNYLCLRKLHDAAYEKRLLTDKETEELEQIEEWSGRTKEGSLSDLPFTPSFSSWDRVCAEGDTCTQRKCLHFKECHFFKARKEAEEAQILVANHSMLFADLSFRAEKKPSPDEPGLLPPYSRIILDEAHHIEQVATDFFAKKVSYLQIIRWLGKLGGEKQGKLPLLDKKLLSHYTKKIPDDVSSIHMRLSIDLVGMRTRLTHHLAEAFDALSLFMQHKEPSEDLISRQETKLRVLAEQRNHPFWIESIEPKIRVFIEENGRYTQSVMHILSDLSNLDNPKFEEESTGIRQEITALTNRLSQVNEYLKLMMDPAEDGTKVFWVESKTLRTTSNVTLILASLDISEQLVNSVFLPYPTAVLCSATLATNNNFKFMRERLGLNSPNLEKKHITERIYPSPFNYEKQSLLLIPKDMPNPSSSQFTDAACEKIWQSIEASRGNAFLLFTSYSMLQDCYNQLIDRLNENRYPALKQGDANRKNLLEQFKALDRSVLFGTDSFWEGVDVAGESLRCVVIVKLPFRVPTEPIIQARTEAITVKGGDPFFDYSIPNAIVKFKQGFGRLIRNKRDRGCVVCLDPRLITKNYGRLFLDSLPDCQKIISDDTNHLKNLMEDFYRRTYSLTKG